MKAWSVIGLLFAAAILASVPVSPQVTSRGVELSVGQAQAQTYRRARVTARRVGRRSYRYARRAYRRGAYYGAAPAYYGGYTYGAAPRLLRWLHLWASPSRNATGLPARLLLRLPVVIETHLPPVGRPARSLPGLSLSVWGRCDLRELRHFLIIGGSRRGTVHVPLSALAT